MSLLALTVLLSGCGHHMMATPLVYQNSSTPIFAELAPQLQGDQLSILYVTDRVPASTETDQQTFYTSGRSASAVLGVAEIDIDYGLRSSRETTSQRSVSGPSTDFVSPTIELVSIKELVRFPATPYPYTVGEQGRITPDPEVASELRQATAAARREVVARLALTDKKEVFVFVHGVGNQFDRAILSAAELWHFLGREGVPIVYTWPAGAGGLFFYTTDSESGEFTVLHLKQFLRSLADMPEIEKIHIAAHSRGTAVATSALRELIIEARAAGIDPRARYKIDNLVLVAADLDLGVAMQRLVGEALGPAFGQVTIYTNAEDSALGAAKSLFNSSQRVGDLLPAELTPQQREVMLYTANLDIIVYQGSGGGLFRHAYYTDPLASSDMLMLLRYGWRPGEGRRQGLERIGPRIWRLTNRARDH